MMTKNLLTSSLITLTLICGLAQSHATTVNQTTVTTQQYNKNLVNEWVKYKFIYAELEQEGSAMQANIVQQLGKKNKTGSTINTESQLKKLVNDAHRQLERIQPQTAEIKKLLKLQAENLDMMLKVMPNHFKIMAEGENTKVDTGLHFEEFMKFSETTAAVNTYEKEVENLVMQYLKNHPLN